MNINDTIKQSIDNIPAVKKFSEKKSVRFWKKWGLLPFVCSASLYFMSGFVAMSGIVSKTTSGLVCLMALIGVFVSLAVNVYQEKKFKMKAKQIGCMVKNNTNFISIMKPASDQMKLDTVNALLKTDADRTLVEEVVKHIETDLPLGWWLALHDAAHNHVQEQIVIEINPKEQIRELLALAQSNQIASPVKKQWRI